MLLLQYWYGINVIIKPKTLSSILEQAGQAVEVYRRQSDTLWTLHPFGPGDQVEFASLSLSFPIAALYENIGLQEDFELGE